MDIKFKHPRAKIANKFFISTVLVVLIPAFLLFYLLQYHFQEYIYDKISDNVISSSERNEAEIKELSQSMMSMILMFLRDEEFSNTLAQENPEPYEVNKVFNSLCEGIANLSLSSVGHIEMTFLDKNEHVYSSWGNNGNFKNNLIISGWIEEAKNLHGGAVWKAFTPAFSDTEKNAGEQYTSLVCALYHPQNLNNYLGAIIISVKESYLKKVFQKYNYFEDLIYVCTEGGKVSMMIDENSLVFPADLEYAAIMLKSKPSATVKVSGTKYIVTKCTLPSAWQNDGDELISLRFTEQNNLTLQFSEFTKLISILLLVAVLVIVLLTYLLICRLVKPISNLSHKMRHYSIDKKIVGLDLERDDEIGDLNRSFVQMSDYSINLVHQIQEESAFKEKYQYEALVAQLTPHFLFNTLNTIRWMAMIRKADNIVHCIDALGNLLRYSMNKEGEIVPLREEIVQIKSYIDIQNYRYGGNLKLDIQIDEDLLDLKVVKFILQPIVENSAKHAFNEKKDETKISVSAEVDTATLRIFIIDNGSGITPEDLESINEKESEDAPPNSVTGIGIHHVNKRIKALYGCDFGIVLDSKEQQYTKVTFKLPLLRGDSGNEKDIDC